MFSTYASSHLSTTALEIFSPSNLSEAELSAFKTRETNVGCLIPLCRTLYLFGINLIVYHVQSKYAFDKSIFLRFHIHSEQRTARANSLEFVERRERGGEGGGGEQQSNVSISKEKCNTARKSKFRISRASTDEDLTEIQSTSKQIHLNKLKFV